GKKYSDYYENCKDISIEFVNDSDVEATISSTDFVGNFSDKLKGKYTLDSNRAVIQWTEVDYDNSEYKTVPTTVDTVAINETKNTITLFQGGEKYLLEEYNFFEQFRKVDKSQRFEFIVIGIIFGFIIVIKNYWYILLLIIIAFWGITIYRKRKGNTNRE
ncbi:MAG: hypothetical protein Q4D23_04960, partial [Bacteroidales bacterium]|nr:hypothetical protein [Bacteroidales bacterium]